MDTTRSQTPYVPRQRKRPKDLSVEAVRGLAALLMVAGHVIGNTSDRGMGVADDSVWRLFYLGLEDIRMPLFTVISGYVYAMRPVEQRDDFPQLVRGKARRLLLPLLTVGALLFAMKLLIPAANTRPELGDFWKTYVYGYEHLWFLEAIFLVFLAVALLGIAGALSTLPKWCATTGAAFVLYALVSVPEAANVFSINGAIRLLPFFLLGYGMYRFELFQLNRWGLVGAAALFASIYTLKLASLIGDWEPNEVVRRLVSVAVGVSGIVLIFAARKAFTWKWLAAIGPFAFGIYLLHVFGSAATRIALEKAGIGWLPAVFVVGLAVGVGAPIVFQLLFGRWNIVRTFVLGEKPIRRATPQAAASGTDEEPTAR
ncbi:MULTISPECIES: acyltransferase family protein [Rhodococcus]|uniref:acyltransferase family protein n=1 Tax=Rhodococcus TaxID=1827 RepID=UPI001E62364A|nr:acyltransferase [Rhodococcus pyridinivorans]MCD2116815.1 acyltransferase [Rhodococcus pyridinivorans]MCZ4625977.1 acyltransferase [Rhodococcus pyridinivorans]MCZ4646932.1 acyltransferase [Rhodococcus pyridinivorans]MDJ0480284.1 acyltransferase [Rhodococcus pyridinivorans]MDV7253035.1 acyltransferase [Rhodococcus pyridinivorans]